ncbi:MAG TPA: hypothetical protein VF440_06870 [Novosphingobium sp.]
MKPLSLEAIEARDAIARGKTLLRNVRHGGFDVELLHHKADLWVVLRRDAQGGVALRTPLLAEGAKCTAQTNADECLLTWQADNEAGHFRAELRGEPTGLEHFAYRMTFRPRRPVHVPHFPRDMMVFGREGDPLSSEGSIEARQRRLNTGLCYLNITKPAIGKLLYVQNLTALNAYFRATQTKPESAVGGEWPMLGYLPPTQPGDPSKALPADKDIVLYDTRLVFRQKPEEEEAENAWQFLDMLGAVYRNLDQPAAERRDWVGRSRQTLRDLEKSPKARERHYGQVYFHPYTGAEYPDAMVQLSLLSAIRDWGGWEGKKHPLEAVIRRGLTKFYDPKLKTLRRYLPDVGDDKNADAVDSWYLYHPLLNLSNLALAGDETARELFLGSIDYGIRAAQHFQYKWPIQYDATDFSVITPVAPADERGQTDVGGIYAWVMLQAFELTSEVRFLDEARNALEAARGMRFDLNYQANLTAWGAAACIRLWRITNRKTYLALSYVYLASFFHNAQMWESQIGHARHYSNFLGVTCLQDAPYMALYECFDSYTAFERFLDLGGPDLIPAAKMLVTEYCRYALHRAWFYYPDALPRDAIATQIRNGEIDRALSFPLEDLYPDGQPAGQVGQEIYGAGAAMIFATRAFHRVEDAPFVLFCDHFLRAITRLDHTALSLRIDGQDNQAAEFALVRAGRKALPEAIVRTLDGKVLEPRSRTKDAACYRVPAYSGLVLSWR